MVNLKHAVQSQGFTVAHIKTDSIKIPDATPEIIKFVTEYGKLYGYNFEHEATYDRMCLVNDAVYIARYATVEKCCDLYGKKYIDSARYLQGEQEASVCMDGDWHSVPDSLCLQDAFQQGEHRVRGHVRDEICDVLALS